MSNHCNRREKLPAIASAPLHCRWTNSVSLMPSFRDNKTAGLLQAIFRENFGIGPGRFNWDLPLEDLDVRFKVLGNLVFLEQLLQKEFQKEIPLLENICTAFHTPGDILELIEEG